MRAVDQVLKSFNFGRVHRAMVLLRWAWWDGAGKLHVPSVSQLKRTAGELLGLAVREEAHAFETGGFRAEKVSGELRLTFVLGEASAEM